MRILIASASLHGSTAQIADAIAEEIRAALPSAEVDVRAVHEVGRVDGYDVVILGSAVYTGHWLAEAVRFVRANAPILFTRAVWLFSSGPVGKLRPFLEPIEAAEMAGISAAREHRVFDGCLDRSQLRWYGRALATATHAPEGDFRDWQAIRGWARGISVWLRTHETTRHTLERR
ncbi:flavodoxin domain-containing protein [Actinokineospora xionganensis]|uniref:Flavodoxin domain-containing protein n=1 Tax=Actinokineospora xionganensis TaxID=2684470 RepID=A0ABR7KZG9_9PSEU|nr:flavodoxin domain-containing protein [Actinokineospora xionganensis]MBC6445828.1 hypothetical protein [Actinokineospora xionganensis]